MRCPTAISPYRIRFRRCAGDDAPLAFFRGTHHLDEPERIKVSSIC